MNCKHEDTELREMVTYCEAIQFLFCKDCKQIVPMQEKIQ